MAFNAGIELVILGNSLKPSISLDIGDPNFFGKAIADQAVLFFTGERHDMCDCCWQCCTASLVQSNLTATDESSATLRTAIASLVSITSVVKPNLLLGT